MELTISNLSFYSHVDEANFFGWISQIKSVKKCEGRLHDLVLTFESSMIPDSDLWELLAVFRRYNLDLSKLATFSNEENEAWFSDETMVWFDDVFRKN
jgi:hypothetical protein